MARERQCLLTVSAQTEPWQKSGQVPPHHPYAEHLAEFVPSSAAGLQIPGQNTLRNAPERNEKPSRKVGSAEWRMPIQTVASRSQR